MGKYADKNASPVLEQVENLIDKIESGEVKRYRIDKVYEELSIFDWWNDYLSKTQLMDMERFLFEAIKLGYTGYVCFKVGASGCANGMWAHKEESETGHSPDCDCLYKSFTPSYNYWSIQHDGCFYPLCDENNNGYDSIKTIKQLEELFVSLKKGEEK